MGSFKTKRDARRAANRPPTPAPPPTPERELFADWLAQDVHDRFESSEPDWSAWLTEHTVMCSREIGLGEHVGAELLDLARRVCSSDRSTVEGFVDRWLSATSADDKHRLAFVRHFGLRSAEEEERDLAAELAAARAAEEERRRRVRELVARRSEISGVAMTPVGELALLGRIRRKLKSRGERLESLRGRANYYGHQRVIVDAHSNTIVGGASDLEALGREIGALATSEFLVEEGA